MILKSMDGFCMPITLGILSGEEDLPFDLTLDLPVKFPQVDPLSLIPIFTPQYLPKSF